jgi:hypothetical protein
LKQNDRFHGAKPIEGDDTYRSIFASYRGTFTLSNRRFLSQIKMLADFLAEKLVSIIFHYFVTIQVYTKHELIASRKE